MEIQKVKFTPFVPFLILISFTSFLNLLARTIFPPMTPYICDEMNLCHADTGNLFFNQLLSFLKLLERIVADKSQFMTNCH